MLNTLKELFNEPPQNDIAPKYFLNRQNQFKYAF